jgi:hypothetical protein
LMILRRPPEMLLHKMSSGLGEKTISIALDPKVFSWRRTETAKALIILVQKPSLGMCQVF